MFGVPVSSCDCRGTHSLRFYEVDYILDLRSNTRKTMGSVFTEGLKGFETMPLFLNNAAFCLVPHKASSECLFNIEYRSVPLCACHINAG